MKFTKMHGLGNDYVVINLFEETVENPSALAVKLLRRNFNIGADSLVLIGPSDSEDFSMRIFNLDGSEAQMCGNALRCVGKFVYERGLTDKLELGVETLAGTKHLNLSTDGKKVVRVKADMGAPIFIPSLIPIYLGGEFIRNHRVNVLGKEYAINAVSMGNPHCVIFVKDNSLIDIEQVGPAFENHELFPERANISFATVTRRDSISLRVWERGCGETLACGTGACATLACGVMLGICDRSAQISLKGGNLELSWNVLDNHIYQSGPANFVFDGVTIDD